MSFRTDDSGKLRFGAQPTKGPDDSARLRAAAVASRDDSTRLKLAASAEEVPDADDLSKKTLARLVTALMRTLLQASYYSGAHPEHQANCQETFAQLSRVLRNRRELAICRVVGTDAADLELCGAVNGGVSVRALVAGTDGETFFPKFADFFARNTIVALRARRNLSATEFDRFIGLVSQRHFELGDSRKDQATASFDELLQHHNVAHVDVMCEDELIPTYRRVQPRVVLASSRLRRDLRRATSRTGTQNERWLIGATSALIEEAVFALGEAPLLSEMLTNADIIAPQLSNEGQLGLQLKLAEGISAPLCVKVGNQLLSELDQVVQELSYPGTPTKVAEVLGGRKERVEVALKAIARRFGTESAHEAPAEEGQGFLRTLYSRRVLAMGELPVELRQRMSVESWTDEFMRDPNRHLDSLQRAPSPEAYGSLVAALAQIGLELVRRREMSHLFPIAEALLKHSRHVKPPFEQMPVWAHKALDQMWSRELSHTLSRSACSQFRHERQVALRSLAAFGDLSVPALLKALYQTTDKTAHEELMAAIEAIGQPAGEFLTREIETLRHKWHFIVPLLALIGRIGYEPAAQHVARYLRHNHPQVRQEAAATLASLLGDAAHDALILCLDDPDPHVVARIVVSLSATDCARDEYRDFIATLLDSDLQQVDPVLRAALLRAVRAVGNFGVPGKNGVTIAQVLLGQLKPAGALQRLVKKRTLATGQIAVEVRQLLADLGNRHIDSDMVAVGPPPIPHGALSH